ncbi:ribonuclease HI family protein [bacterium]|nr:MAG: ribonuclease HI family protein [bacterium]
MVFINVDGLCEPNPGGVATFGMVAVSAASGKVLAEKSGVAAEGESATNNVAEYRALDAALTWCMKNVAHLVSHNKRIEIRTDSQLVVSQVNGLWKCKLDDLLPLRDAAQSKMKLLDAAKVFVNLTWVPREQNEVADELSRQAFKNYTGRDVPERQPRQPTPGLSGSERFRPQVQKLERPLKA